jgi:WD40 repeat protein
MLDGDTLVQDAQPTGYKLCVCEDTSAWDRVFAVKWSPCVSSSSPSSSAYPSSIFLCARDGKLRRYNFRTGESSTYQVMFRSFTMPMHQGALETAPAKPVLQHWDKMECIPAPAGDQDVSELVFLLGVSRCIYISALPGSSSALAMGTLSDSLDYVHGTSVVEMFSHEHRVTSLSVSNDGALLASGDEQGSLCVQLLRNFGIVHSSAWLTAPVPSSKLRCLQRVHNGPIFAICWLERNIVEETPVYTLATSSHDTVVRIFAVHTVVGSMRVEPAKVRIMMRGLCTNTQHLCRCCTLQLVQSSALGPASLIQLKIISMTPSICGCQIVMLQTCWLGVSIMLFMCRMT